MLPPDCKTEQKDIDDVNKNMLKESIIDDLSGLFKIFGDNTKSGYCGHWIRWMVRWCVGGLSEALNMTNSAISHQLRILKDADLIKGRREGKCIYYSLCDEHVSTILKMALEHRSEGTE